MQLILASTSPRRKELLALLGYSFDICAPAFIEHLDPARSADAQAREFALGKAASCASGLGESLVLGSDTVIAVEGQVIGKPRNRADAETILRRLMGKEHHICTAVAVVDTRSGSLDAATETVRVRMKRWDDGRLRAYLQTDESLGKAGAYSIQGGAADLIESIEGDFTAAVGLPLRLVAAMLKSHGMPAPVDLQTLYRTRPYPNWNRFA